MNTDMKKDAVTLIEVGPRDGFQNIEKLIPTEQKIEIIRALMQSGIPEMELTSFVHPKAIPQLADAKAVVGEVIGDCEGVVKPIALVPNLKGAQNASDCGIPTISFVVSCSEAHNKANVARTREESLHALRDIIKQCPGLKVRVDLATAFGCPYEGEVPEAEVIKMAQAALDAGACELVLCDTIGVANPEQVKSLSKHVLEIAGDVPVALHLHDTRGLGVANIYAGYEAGIRRFEAAAGGLGGCPFAPGAAGNAAMEDVIHLFDSLGIETHISLEKYLSAVELIKRYIKPDLTGRMSYVKSPCKEVSM